MAKRYWICRTDKTRRKFITDRVHDGELRQGWGWLDGQNLRNQTIDKGARRNRSMLRVKAGDLILLPHIPEYGLIAITEAESDWRDSYRYEDASEGTDHRHIFPIKYHKIFSLHGASVPGDLRTTMRTPGRFWNVDRLGSEIEALFRMEESELLQRVDYKHRISRVWENVFEEEFQAKDSSFSKNIVEKFNAQFQSAEWEYLLVEVLKTLVPQYVVERVGGKSETAHGADITIKIPGVFPEDGYVIAIQVKDYEGYTGDKAVQQIQKADAHFASDDDGKLIEKWVIYTKIDEENHTQQVPDEKTRIFYRKDVERLLTQAGFQVMAEFYGRSD